MIYKTHILADYFLEENHKIRTQLVHISDSEICLNTSSPLPKGKSIILEIKFPTSCEHVSTIPGEVKGYEEIITNNLYRCYVLYTDLTEKVKEDINKYFAWHDQTGNPLTQNTNFKIHDKSTDNYEDSKEHRKATRFHTNLSANIFDEISFSMEHSFILDFSKGGMNVKVVNEYPPGYQLMIKVNILGKDIRIHAVVRWIRDLPEGKYQVGMQFHDISQDETKLIEEYLATLKP